MDYFFTETALPALLSVIALFFINWGLRKPKPKPKQYRYELFGGPYNGDTLVIEWDDIVNYTDRTLRFDDHYGFYTIVGFHGYYGIKEHEPGDYPAWQGGDVGIFERSG